MKCHFLQVNISVIDVEDGPRFTPDHVDLFVGEDAEVGTLVYIASATGQDGQVRYRINGDDDLFSAGTMSGEIKLANRLDYEMSTVHQFVVMAWYTGVPRTSSEMKITVNVLDVNDNSPMFSEEKYLYDIVDSLHVGDVLGVVQARDSDSGVNGHVTYYLDCSEFSIDPMNGTLSTNIVLDPEVPSGYLLTVIAADDGVPPKYSNVTVFVSVGRQKPLFLEDSFIFLIEENLPPLSLVGQVLARGSHLDGHMTYSLDVNAQNYFEINERSGEILTKRSLDREETKIFTFKVHALDAGLSVSASVIVRVLDVNDNTPEFISSYVEPVYLTENTQQGTSLLKVTAVDRDFGENGTVTYHLDTGKRRISNLRDIILFFWKCDLLHS